MSYFVEDPQVLCPSLFFKKVFVYLFSEGGERREEERERNIGQSPITRPELGTWPAARARAWTNWNLTRDFPGTGQALPLLQSAVCLVFSRSQFNLVRAEPSTSCAELASTAWMGTCFPPRSLRWVQGLSPCALQLPCCSWVQSARSSTPPPGPLLAIVSASTALLLEPCRHGAPGGLEQGSWACTGSRLWL